MSFQNGRRQNVRGEHLRLAPEDDTAGGEATDASVDVQRRRGGGVPDGQRLSSDFRVQQGAAQLAVELSEEEFKTFTTVHG